MFGLFKDSKREQLEKEVILATLRTHLTIANLCKGKKHFNYDRPWQALENGKKLLKLNKW